jgi:hypothetical protein
MSSIASKCKYVSLGAIEDEPGGELGGMAKRSETLTETFRLPAVGCRHCHRNGADFSYNLFSPCDKTYNYSGSEFAFDKKKTGITSHSLYLVFAVSSLKMASLR